MILECLSQLDYDKLLIITSNNNINEVDGFSISKPLVTNITMP